MVSFMHLETTLEVVELVKFIFDLSEEQQTKLIKEVALLKKEEGILLYKKDDNVRFGNLEEYRESKIKLLYTITIQKNENNYSILMSK